MVDLRNLNALIIDPSSGMRSSIHNMLTSCGINKVDHAVSSGTAIRQVRNKKYDLILCEYDLSEGQDGQQLLEDLRNNKLIPLWTMYFILTAERSSQKVMSVAELAPTDYLLKPFTHDGMLERVGRAVEWRQHFMAVFKMIESGDLDLAIKACAAVDVENARLAADFMRLQAECAMTLGRAAEAELLYRKILASRPVGWATLGLARTVFAQERFEEVETTLMALIEESDKFLDAYDLLAKARHAMGKFDEAKAILASAVKISPHAVRRLRTLGKLALETGDASTAESLLTQVVGKSRYSEFRDAEDHVHLVTALVQQGDTKQASTMIRDLEKTFSGQKKTLVCKALLNGMLNDANGDTELAATNFATAVTLFGEAEGLSSDIKLTLAKNCLEHEMEGEASTILLDIINNAKDGAASDRAMAVFAEAGHGELALKIAQESRQMVVQLLSSGAEKAKAGDFPGAVTEMNKAAQKMPENAQVIFNAAVAALKCLENVAWNEVLGANARWYIETARRLDPANPRMASLVALYTSILKKYKIATADVLPIKPARIDI